MERKKSLRNKVKAKQKEAEIQAKLIDNEDISINAGKKKSNQQSGNIISKDENKISNGLVENPKSKIITSSGREIVKNNIMVTVSREAIETFNSAGSTLNENTATLVSDLHQRGIIIQHVSPKNVDVKDNIKSNRPERRKSVSFNEADPILLGPQKNQGNKKENLLDSNLNLNSKVSNLELSRSNKILKLSHNTTEIKKVLKTPSKKTATDNQESPKVREGKIQELSQNTAETEKYVKTPSKKTSSDKKSPKVREGKIQELSQNTGDIKKVLKTPSKKTTTDNQESPKVRDGKIQELNQNNTEFKKILKTPSKKTITENQKSSKNRDGKIQELVNTDKSPSNKPRVRNNSKNQDVTNNVIESMINGVTACSVQLESTPVAISRQGKSPSSAWRKSIISSISKTKSKKLAVRFGDTSKDSESEMSPTSARRSVTTSPFGVFSSPTVISGEIDSNVMIIPKRFSSPPKVSSKEAPSVEKKPRTSRKRTKKNVVEKVSSDDETIASFISKEHDIGNVVETTKKEGKHTKKSEKKKRQSEELTHEQVENASQESEEAVLGSTQKPKKQRRQSTPRRRTKQSSPSKTQHIQEDKENMEMRSPQENKENVEIMESIYVGEKKARGRPRKSPGERKKYVRKPKTVLQVKVDSEDPGFFSDFQTPDAANESFVEEGNKRDMPVISSATKVVTKLKQENESVTLLEGIKPQRGRKRNLDDTAPKKKRGRKKMRKEVLFLDTHPQRGETEDEDLEDDEEEGGSSLIQRKRRKLRKKTQKRTGRRFSVTGNWYIAAGYLNDIISLLEDFDSMKSWRFKDFAACWRDKRFSLVFRGRQTFKELLEFSEEMALLTKRFLSPPHSIKRRIGALYTLYGLYYKFPLGKRQFFNLRFELREYEELLTLISPFRSNIENPDPAYIFRKLEVEGAILHCATAFEPCYDFHNEERDFVELEYGKERLAKSSAVSNAIPKIQLQADLDLLQYYHSIKAKVAGQDAPEKALTMITPEFLEGIGSNLTNLRLNTLEELGMTDDGNLAVLRDQADVSRIENRHLCSQVDNLDANKEIELYSVGQDILDTVNKGTSGQRTQKAIENNQLVNDTDVKDFMRLPIDEDLQQPLLLQKKRGRPKKMHTYSMDWNDKILKNEVETMESDGRVMLDIDEEPLEEYQELTEVLLPQPLRPKKKRKPKRPPTLLREASYPSKRPKVKQEGISIVKSLMDEPDNSESDNALGKSDIPEKPAPVSATRFLASELPDVKPKEVGTIIKVWMRADGIKKIIKLKVKVSPEQFNEIRRNPPRYENFKEKLKPLIKMTQKNENKNKDWNIEDILPFEGESPIKTQQDIKKEPIPSSASFSPSKKTVPYKLKYECLRHSDDEEEENVDETDDEDLFPCKWKTEEDKDGDYDPPELDEEDEQDPLEYEPDGDIEEDDYDYAPAPQYFWRKRGRRSYYGYYFEERGPRDSDQLLKARSENSISMIPVKVGGAVKYFPMINTKEQPVEQKSPEKSPVEEEETEKVEVEEEVEELPKDPKDMNSLFTWNDFSSDKSPPFKKRRGSKSVSLYFSPNLSKLNTEGRAPLRKIASSTTFKPFVKKEEPEHVSPVPEEEVEGGEEDIEEPVSLESKGIGSLTEMNVDENTMMEIKKELTMLEELAEDWEEDEESVVSGSRTPLNKNQRPEIDPLVEQNGNPTDSSHDVAGSSDSPGKFKHEVFIEESDVYPLDNIDIVDATDFHAEDEEEEEEEDDQYVDAYDDTVAPDDETASKDFNGSYIEGIDEFQEVSEILPHISEANTSYAEQIFTAQDKNGPLPGSSSTPLPGSFSTPLPGSFSTPLPGSFSTPLPGSFSTPLPGSSSTVLGNMLLNTPTTTGGQRTPESYLPTLPSSELVDINLSIDKQLAQPLYYKMTTVDGKSAFIPIFSMPQPPENIEVLSFDVADVKPYIPSSDSPDTSYSTSQIQTPYSEMTPYSLTTSTPLSQQNDNILAGVPTPNIFNQPSFSDNLGVSPQSNLFISEPSNDLTNGKGSCNFLMGRKAPAQRSCPKVQLNDSSTPSCPFFFSPKFKFLKNLPSAKGMAAGKITTITKVQDKPKVKFFLKGSFKV